MTITGNTLNMFARQCCGTQFNCGSFTNALLNPTSFGFFFKASSSAPTYYSLDQLNPAGRQDRGLAFQDGSTTNWLFATRTAPTSTTTTWPSRSSRSTAAVPQLETYAMVLPASARWASSLAAARFAESAVAVATGDSF